MFTGAARERNAVAPGARRRNAWWRIGVTVVSIAALQALVCGVAALPVVLIWTALLARLDPAGWLRPVVVGFLLVPSYVAFALCLITTSAVVTRTAGLRTPRDAEMPIGDLEWRLLRWVHYAVAIHIVRVFAGTLFRGSPIWSLYLRMNGARVGRRVYVNSLAMSDHNLLELGDDVVIGEGVHLSGHTVEAGVVKTGGVRLGRGVTIGVGAIVGIGVDAGAECQVGAMSLVPKHTTLEGGAVYAGIPARCLWRRGSDSRP